MKYKDPLAQEEPLEPSGSSLLPIAGTAAGLGALATGATLALSPTARKFARTNLLDPLSTNEYTKPVMQFFKGMRYQPGVRQGINAAETVADVGVDVAKAAMKVPSKVIDDAMRTADFADSLQKTSIHKGLRNGAVSAREKLSTFPGDIGALRPELTPEKLDKATKAFAVDITSNIKSVAAGHGRLSPDDKLMVSELFKRSGLDNVDILAGQNLLGHMKKQLGLKANVASKINPDEFLKLYTHLANG